MHVKLTALQGGNQRPSDAIINKRGRPLTGQFCHVLGQNGLPSKYPFPPRIVN